MPPSAKSAAKAAAAKSKAKKFCEVDARMSDEFRPEDYIPYVPPPRVMLNDDEAGTHQPHVGYTLLLLLIGFILLLVVSAVVIAVGAALHLLPHSVAQASRGFPKTSILIEALTFGATLWVAGLVNSHACGTAASAPPSAFRARDSRIRYAQAACPYRCRAQRRGAIDRKSVEPAKGHAGG